MNPAIFTEELYNGSKNQFATLSKVKKFYTSKYPKGSFGRALFIADVQRALAKADDIAFRSKCKEIITWLDSDRNTCWKTKYSITIMGDAKASANRYALCASDGTPLEYGNFLDFIRKDASLLDNQAIREVHALHNAVRLVKDLCYYRRISLNNITLNYVTDNSGMVGAWHSTTLLCSPIRYLIEEILSEIPISLNLIWIRGEDNFADRYTLKSDKALYKDYKVISKYIETK